MVPSSAPAAADPGRRRTRASPSWRRRCRRATWRGTGRGSRPGWSSAARSSPQSTSAWSTSGSSPARAARHRSGRRSWYCRSIAFSRGDAGLAGRGARRSRRRGAAWPPSRPSWPTDVGSCSSPASTRSHRRSTSAPTASPTQARPCSCSYLWARSSRPHWISSAVARRPSRSMIVRVQRRVVADLADRRHRVAEQPVVAERVVLDHRQHDRRGADLEVGGDLAHVGVADDHVQPAVLLGVAVRLVAGVDDRALQRRLEADLLLEEVGPLAQLVRHVVVGHARQLAADLAGTGEDLAGDEVRRDLGDDAAERRLAGEQVVLVAAVAVALAVGVVLVDDDLGRPSPWQQLRRRAAMLTRGRSPRRPGPSARPRAPSRTRGWRSPGGRGRRSSGRRW